jgi:hypothetical protein
LLVVLAEDPLWLDAFEVSPGVFAPSYSPREDRLLISSLLSEGVLDVAAGEMRVRQRAAGANMSVDIDPGRAAITGDDAADQGRYLMREPTVINRSVPTAPLTDSRIDRVIARVYDKTVTGTVHGWDYEVISGAVSATPVAPEVPKGAISIARFTVTSSTVAITDAMIVDERPQAALSFGDVKAAGASLPRGVRAFRNDQGTTADFGNDALVPGYALSFTAQAGRLYRVTAFAHTVDDQAGTTGTFAGGVDFRLRTEFGATAVGTGSPSRGVRRVPLYGNGSQNAESLLVVGFINNPPAGNVNVAMTGTLVAPATLWRLLQDPGAGFIVVEDVGAAR